MSSSIGTVSEVAIFLMLILMLFLALFLLFTLLSNVKNLVGGAFCIGSLMV